MLSPCQKQLRCQRLLSGNPVKFIYIHFYFNNYRGLPYHHHHHQVGIQDASVHNNFLWNVKFSIEFVLDLRTRLHFINAHSINQATCKLWKAKRFHDRKQIVNNTHVHFYKTGINPRIRCCLVNTFHFVN